MFLPRKVTNTETIRYTRYTNILFRQSGLSESGESRECREGREICARFFCIICKPLNAAIAATCVMQKRQKK